MGQKRGQIAIFIIIGLVLLIAAGVVVYVTSRPSTAVAEQARFENPATQLQAIVNDCLRSQGIPLLQLLARRGGTLVPGTRYRGEDYNPFCVDVDPVGCANIMRTKRMMAAEFDAALVPKLEACIDLAPLQKQGFTVVERGAVSTSTIIAFDEVTVVVEAPIKLSRGGETLSFEKIAENVQSPIGRMHSLALFLINRQVRDGYMDKDSWMVSHGVSINVSVDRPYPDTMLTLAAEDDAKRPYAFHVMMKGTATAKTPTDPRPARRIFETCFLDGDCFDNVASSFCAERDGEAVSYNDSRCVPPFPVSRLCDGRPCRDCMVEGTPVAHGTQWCVSTAPREDGLDPTGSRHAKASCIDGTVLVEPCRDFREELCTEDGGIAGCRENRWHDCWLQRDAASCNDLTRRDCYWKEGLVPSPSITFLAPGRDNDRCLPYVGPGLEHWKKSGKLVCEMGNEQVWEDIGVFSEAISWKPPVVHSNGMAEWCYSLGDCGNKKNIVQYGPDKRYKSSTGKPDKSLAIPGKTEMLTLPLGVSPFRGIDAMSFYYPQGDPDYMKQKTQEYIAWLLSLDPLAVLADQVPLHIVHSTHCKVAQAPWRKARQNCDLCKDGFAGCSEYLCKSLGRKCEFSMDGNGFPLCVLRGEDKPLDIRLEFPGRTASRMIGGYAIDEPLNPWEQLNISVNTDAPATCTVSMLPGDRNLESREEDEGEIAPLRVFFDLITSAITPGTDGFNADFREPSTKQDLHFEAPDVSTFNFINQQESTTAFFANPLDSMTLFATVASYIRPDSKASEALDAVEKAWAGSLDAAMKESVSYNSLGTKVDMLLSFNGLRKVPVELRLYLSCTDLDEETSGGIIVVQVKIKKDDLPAQVVNVTPMPPAPMPASLRLSLNEPAECRFAIDGDKDFDVMSPMTCDLKSLGTRTCSAEMPVSGPHSVHVRCRDRPFVFTAGTLRITKDGSPPAASGGAITAAGGVLNLTVTPFSSKQEVGYGAPDATTRFVVNSPTKSVCRYGTTSAAYDRLPSMMACKDKACEVSLDTSGTTTYFFSCGYAEDLYQNENPQPFVYTYS